jgi:Glycosyl hydrolases family 25
VHDSVASAPPVVPAGMGRMGSYLTHTEPRRNVSGVYNALAASTATGETFVDIAYPWQTFTDASAYVLAGGRRIAIKATEGLSFVNPRWEVWSSMARAAGVQLLAYHFATTDPPAAQARFFASVAGDADILVLDHEQPSLPANERGPFAGEFFAALPTTASKVLYSGAGYMAGTTLAQIPDVSLWYANYTANIPPEGWTEFFGWQYTSTSTSPGIVGAVDRSLYLGPAEDYVPTLDPADMTTILNQINTIGVMTRVAVLNGLRGDIFGVQPAIRQDPGESGGSAIGATYNKVGDVQARLTALQATVTSLQTDLGSAGAVFAWIVQAVAALATQAGITLPALPAVPAPAANVVEPDPAAL